MNRTILSVLLALLLIPMSVSGADAPTQRADATRAEVQAVVKTLVDATNRADVNAMMGLYSRKPEVTSIGDGEITRGWDAIRTESEQIVGKEGSYKVSVGYIDVTPLGTSYALAVAPLTLTVATEKGTVQLPSAMTMVLVKSASSWTILHDHTSTKMAAVPQQRED